MSDHPHSNSEADPRDSFRLLFERSADPILLMDGEVFIDCNEAAVRMMRCGGKAELLSLHPWQISPDLQLDGRSSVEKAHELISRAFREGTARFEWMHRRQDGSEFPVEVLLTAIPRGDHQVLYTVWRDIQESKDAEEALRESETKFKLLFERSADAIMLLDGEMIVDCNPSAIELIGCKSREELLAIHPSSISPEEQPDGRASFDLANEHMAEARRTGFHRFEWVHRRVDNSVFPAEVLLTAITLRGRQMLYAVVRDITARKRSERALQASEASYRAIFEASHDAIYVHEIETGAVLDMNRKATELHGYSLEEFRRLGLAGIAMGDAPFTAEAALERVRAAAAGEPQLFEWQSRNRAGGLFWVEVNLKRMKIGGRDRLLATSREITDRKCAEEEVKRRAAELVKYKTVLMDLARLDHADFNAAVEIILRADADALRVDRVSVWFFNSAETEIVCSLLYQQSAAAYTTGARIDAQSYPGYFEALRKERVIPAHDAATDPCTREFADGYLAPLGITSMLDVPIWRHGKMIGVVCHEHTGPRRTWSVEEQDFASSIADMVSLAIEASDRHKAETALLSAHEELKQAHEELEARVERRTAELAQTNAALEAEISERRWTQEELLQKTSQLEAIFRAFPDLYFRLTPDCTILAYHAGKTDLYIPPEEFMGQRMQEVLPAEVGAQFEKAVAQVIASGSLASIEYSLPIEKTQRSFEARLLPLLDRQVMVIVRDITERKAGEETLRQSEERFRALIENVSDIITVLSLDGTMVFQSHAIARVLGYSPGELVGQNTFSYLHPDDVPGTLAAIKRVVENPGMTETAEYRFRHRDGHYVFLESMGRTILAGSVEAGIVVNSRDVTERKRINAEIQEAMEAADRANRAKSEFLSRMSHELRTPMNSILGFAQVLTRKELPADQRKSVDHILKAGRHLLELINEVLDISRIEANRMRLSAEPVRISHIVQETVSLMQNLAAERECELRDQIDADEDFFVMADRQRLTQVLINVVSNAVKYNRPGGVVTLTCARTGDDRLRIDVSDTGLGIAAEDFTRLFSPFERLGAEGSDVEGTGLGLALSKRLVEVMGGTMGVESVPGEGSTFWVELALAESPQERLQRTRPVTPGGEIAPAAPHTLTVLYIEDNLANFSLIETVFAERPEIRLLSALQGRLGLGMASEYRPDLILLDLHLPDISGEEVFRRLKAIPETAALPVVIVSADATESHIQQMLAAGARGYLTKPLDVDRLLGLVDELIREQSGGAAK